MNDSGKMEITTEQHEKGVIVSPHGEIDLSRAPTLRASLSDVQSGKPECVVVDLTDVPYMDSSGVATLVEAMQISRKNGGRLILCCLQDKVRSIFEIARLDMVFTITSSVEEAINGAG